MVKAQKPPELTAEENKLFRYLEENGWCTEKELSEFMDKSSAGIVDLAQKLRNKGIPVWKDGEAVYLGSSPIELPPEHMNIKESVLKIGIIADTIVGSKYEQPTALRKAFLIAEHEGVNAMIHLDVSAGKPTAAKKEEFHKSTAEEQIEHIVKTYPSSNKFKVRLISGHRDMTWRKDGINILAAVCEQRSDLIYRGDYQSDFPLRRGANEKWPTLKAAYHGGDDSPYSKSYAVQGFAENLVQDINDLVSEKVPEIVVVAGQGVFCDLSGGVIKHLFSAPGIRMVSPSVMKKKRRSVVPTIGFVIVTVTFNGDGKFKVTVSCYPLQSIKNDYREKYSEDVQKIQKLNGMERKVLQLLEETPKSRGELAQAINKSDKSVCTIIASLQRAGYPIEGPDEIAKHYKLQARARSTPKRDINIDFGDYFHETVTHGDVSDTHVGHGSELIEILHEAYDVFAKRGIKTVNHTGDITNGSPKHREHMKGEVLEFRATPLTNRVIAEYPKRDGVVTKMISGDHDRWFLDEVGYDLLDVIAQVRPDIVRMGIQQGEYTEGKVITLLRHFNWGTGYAKSYKPQQVIELGLLKEFEKETSLYKGKVLAVLSGGGHVYCAMLYKGFIFILLPCLQGKTGFISGLGKISDVGFVIHSVTYSTEGVLTRFSVEYFDRGTEALALVRKNSEAKKETAVVNGSKKKEKK